MKTFRLLGVFISLAVCVRAEVINLRSPDQKVIGQIMTDRAGVLTYSVEREGRVMLAPSRIGLTLEGVDLGADVELGRAEFGEIDETYPLPGWKSTALNQARTVTIPLKARANGAIARLEARAYNDGFAWRLIVPGEGTRRVQGEASSWVLPARSKVWFFERASDWKLKSYAGEWIAADVERLATISKLGPVQGPPLVAELPDRAGYVLVSEAALENYSGLRLRASPGTSTLQADFTEGAQGFVVTGPITTPWRVTLVAPDLDALVNSALITNLAPAPDAKLFADQSYIKPGRAVWRWWSSGTGTPAEEKQFVDYAAALGFEYTLVDDGWKDWPDAWRSLQGVVDYARDREIGVLIWKDYKEVAAPAENWAQLRALLDAARDIGVAGVKLDFLNAESKDRIEFTTAALRLAAERRLLVVFHGVAKPTGEARTYPNEITREGIRGLELNKMKEGPIPASHNAALPFTRFVVGAGDYTPLGYSKPGLTTWAHQLATFVQFTSPLQVMAEHPEKVLNDPATQPALDVLKAIPSVWAETRVLAPSTIGGVSVIARRTGSTWFLSVLTGAAPVTLEALDLSFLGDGRYRAIELTSPAPGQFARRESPEVTAKIPWKFTLQAGDGAVVQFIALQASAGLPESQTRGGLPHFHAKASAGGPVRVAFLGGSITAANGWRVKTREFLAQRYPQAKAEEIYAAIPGTGSPLGASRFQRDVLDHQPDLLFVEFAVNDGAQPDALIERAMEGIVRQQWRVNPQADICFVYTLSKNMVKDYEAGRLNNSATAMERVADRYGIPSIVFGVDVVKQLGTGKWVFQADKKLGEHDAEGRTIFSNDGTHPIDAGHALYFGSIERSWPALVATREAGVHPLGGPLRSDNWEHAGFVPVSDTKRFGTWQELPADEARVASQPGKIAPPTWWTDTPGSGVEANVSGSVIGLYGFKSEQSGKLRVTVDDLPPVEATLRDAFSVAGHYRLKAWFYPTPLAPGPHRVRVELLPASSGQTVELLLCGVLYSGDRP